VFRDLAHAQAYLKSDLFKPGLDKLRSLGAIVLDTDWTWMQKDPRGLIAVRPIRTPKDLEGLKLRIWESKTAIETWRGLGANTIVVPRPEMYLAFKQGIIEGGPETIGIAYDQKNAEVAKYWTRTDEYYQIVNLDDERAEVSEPRAAAAAVAAPGGEGRRRRLRGRVGARLQRQEGQGAEGLRRDHLEPDLGPWRKQAEQVLVKLEADGVDSQGPRGQGEGAQIALYLRWSKAAIQWIAVFTLVVMLSINTAEIAHRVVFTRGLNWVAGALDHPGDGAVLPRLCADREGEGVHPGRAVRAPPGPRGPAAP